MTVIDNQQHKTKIKTTATSTKEEKKSKPLQTFHRITDGTSDSEIEVEIEMK